MRIAESACRASKDALWERYSRIIEEYVALGCTKVVLENVPNWAKEKFINHGYILEDNGIKTTVLWGE